MPNTDASSRYRCTACGNLTRFDVTATIRQRAFHHYSAGGELEVLDVETLHETIEEVVCRWCGTGTSVVAVAPDEAVNPTSSAEAPTDGRAGG